MQFPPWRTIRTVGALAWPSLIPSPPLLPQLTTTARPPARPSPPANAPPTHRRLTRFCTRKLRLTALPWLMAWRATVRKPWAKKVEMKAAAMPTSVNTRDTSAGCGARDGRHGLRRRPVGLRPRSAFGAPPKCAGGGALGGAAPASTRPGPACGRQGGCRCCRVAAVKRLTRPRRCGSPSSASRLPARLTPLENCTAKNRMHADTTDSGSCTQKDPNARLRIMGAWGPRESALTGTSPAAARTSTCAVRGGAGGARACACGVERAVACAKDRSKPGGGERRGPVAAGPRGARSRAARRGPLPGASLRGLVVSRAFSHPECDPCSRNTPHPRSRVPTVGPRPPPACGRRGPAPPPAEDGEPKGPRDARTPRGGSPQGRGSRCAAGSSASWPVRSRCSGARGRAARLVMRFRVRCRVSGSSKGRRAGLSSRPVAAGDATG
jgi:hypothetical protein